MMKVVVEGLDELIKKVDEISGENGIKKTNRKIVKKCGEVARATMKPKIPKSKDIKKSGAQHKGSRRVFPTNHAADAIPMRISTKKGYVNAVVGWEKGDNEENFYTKFLNWGTSKIKPLGFIEKTIDECDKEFSSIAQEEYEKVVKELE